MLTKFRPVTSYSRSVVVSLQACKHVAIVVYFIISLPETSKIVANLLLNSEISNHVTHSYYLLELIKFNN